VLPVLFQTGWARPQYRLALLLVPLLVQTLMVAAPAARVKDGKV
jgi:hypothetical protein